VSEFREITSFYIRGFNSEKDTGSSDMWAISDTSVAKSPTGVPALYPNASFQPTGLEARLLYGDSTTGTHAYGLIGRDTVSLAGFTLGSQYFAAINDTNTTVLDTGCAGIFGLGFPLNR
jgi:Eukaryotic aspartyl protease